jgi:hypothetical protein
MGAAPTFPGAHTIRPGDPLRLRYALYVHNGIPTPEQIEFRWKTFSGSEFVSFPTRK